MCFNSLCSLVLSGLFAFLRCVFARNRPGAVSCRKHVHSAWGGGGINMVSSRRAVCMLSLWLSTTEQGNTQQIKLYLMRVLLLAYPCTSAFDSPLNTLGFLRATFLSNEATPVSYSMFLGVPSSRVQPVAM